MKLWRVVAGIAAKSFPAESGDGRARPPELTGLGLSAQGGPPSPQSWEDVLRELNRVRTPQECAAAIERTKRESSVPHYYPDAPEDLTQEPPPLGWPRAAAGPGAGGPAAGAQ